MVCYATVARCQFEHGTAARSAPKGVAMEREPNQSLPGSSDGMHATKPDLISAAMNVILK